MELYTQAEIDKKSKETQERMTRTLLEFERDNFQKAFRLVKKCENLRISKEDLRQLQDNKANKDMLKCSLLFPYAHHTNISTTCVNSECEKNKQRNRIRQEKLRFDLFFRFFKKRIKAIKMKVLK